MSLECISMADELGAMQRGGVKVVWSSVRSTPDLFKSFLSAGVSHCHRCYRQCYRKSSAVPEDAKRNSLRGAEAVLHLMTATVKLAVCETIGMPGPN